VPPWASVVFVKVPVAKRTGDSALMTSSIVSQLVGASVLLRAAQVSKPPLATAWAWAGATAAKSSPAASPVRKSFFIRTYALWELYH